MKRSPIRKSSKRRVKEWREYVKVRKLYLSDHPKCECCNGKDAVEVHHRKGRGIYLCMIQYFMAVCMECHNLIEKERAWANRMGYLLDRIGHE